MRIDPGFTLMSSAIAIIIVIGLRKLFRNMVSIQWLSLLWIPIVLQLLIPIRIHSSFSAYQTVQTMVPIMIRLEQAPAAPIKDEAIMIPDQPKETRSIDWRLFLYYSWGIGIILAACYEIVMEQRLVKQIKQKRVTDPVLERRVQLIVQGELPVVLLDSISNCALFQNQILISTKLAMLNDQELQMVLRHEIIHYRRKHHWILLVTRVLTVIYFFHPLVHVMKRLIYQDLDDIVDQEVVRSYERKEYCHLLIKLGEESSDPFIPSMKRQGGIRQMKRRLLAIMKSIQTGRVMKVMVGCCAALILTFLIQPQQISSITSRTYKIPVATKTTRNVSYIVFSEVSVTISGNATDIDSLVTEELVAMVDLDLLTTGLETQMAKPQVQYQSEEIDSSVFKQLTIESEPVEIKQLSEYQEESPILEGEVLPAAKAKGLFRYIYPVDNPKITCTYECYSGHRAVDFQNDQELYGPVYAVADGTVIENNYNNVNGYYLRIAHDQEISTWYGHLKEASLYAEGAAVKQGQVIGTIGMTGVATGPHVHFGFEKNGVRVNPLDYIGK